MEEEPQRIRTDGVAGRLFKDWGMVLVVGLLIFLYALGTTERLDPLQGGMFWLRIEPIILILLGFCLHRISSRNSELTLKENLNREVQIAEAANFAGNRARIEIERLEEKCRNASAVLNFAVGSDRHRESSGDQQLLRTALKILES